MSKPPLSRFCCLNFFNFLFPYYLNVQSAPSSRYMLDTHTYILCVRACVRAYVRMSAYIMQELPFDLKHDKKNKQKHMKNYVYVRVCGVHRNCRLI
jgi:hypothetical protein